MRALSPPSKNSQALPALGICIKAHLPNKKQKRPPLLSTGPPPKKQARSSHRSGGCSWSLQQEPPLPDRCGQGLGRLARWGGRPAWESLPTSVLQQGWEVFWLLPEGLGCKKDQSGERSSQGCPFNPLQITAGM